MNQKERMLANLPYKAWLDGLSEEIVKGIDSQFDPVYAKLMLQLIDLDSEYKMKEHIEVRELAGKNELNCTEFRRQKSEGILICNSITKIHM